MLVSTTNACKALNVHGNTLRRWADEGKIDYKSTPGGHRRFDINSLRPQAAPSIQTSQETEKKRVVYCRVSSHKHKVNLQNQVSYMRGKFPEFDVLQEVGSGLNYDRKVFQRLLGWIMRGLVSDVAVASRDRFCRFGFNLCSFICKTFNVTLHVADQTVLTTPNE